MADGIFETGILTQTDGIRMEGYAYPGSIAVLPDGRLLCCFFGLPVEGPSNSGCYLCFSEDEGQNWSEPQMLIGRDGEYLHADPNVVLDGNRIMIFTTSYRCVGGVHDLSRSWIWKLISEDKGRSWSAPVEMKKMHSYVSGKVHAGMKLRDGTLIMGYSWDQIAEEGRGPHEEKGQRCSCGVLRSTDRGENWFEGADLHVQGDRRKDYFFDTADEPALVLLSDGTLYTLIRTGTDHLWESRSHDGGRTWEPPQPSPFVSHNCPAELLKLTGEPEIVMAVFNRDPVHRRCLSVAYSTDGCQSWSEPKVLVEVPENWQGAYPVACQTPSGLIVVAHYFGKGMNTVDLGERFHIRFVRFDREWLMG